ETGKRAIDFQMFWERVPPLFPGPAAQGPSIVGGVADELRRRWWSALAPEPSARRIQRACAELRGPIATAFDAPCPGWPAARHHSPDVMIAAPSPKAITDGSFLF